MHGWLIIDKPVGPGSTPIVSAVKRALRTGGYGKAKVGHGGTLDPLASGVLPVAIGEATKLAGRMLDAEKEYEFTIRFGEETDTLDAEGAVVARSEVRPTPEQVEAVLGRFTGEIEQMPPAYSALKVEGRRAYDLARAGEEVALKVRRVRVRRLEILPATDHRVGHAPHGQGSSGGRSDPMMGTARSAVEGSERSEHGGVGPLHHASPRGCCAAGSGFRHAPGMPSRLHPPPRSGEDLSEITLSATVSKGTYIRSLARDIARALDTVGHVAMLRRTRAGPFGLDSAISLDKLDELAKARTLEQALLPLTAGLDDIPALLVTPDQARALRQGRRLAGIAANQGLHLATDGSVPVALVELAGDELRVVRGFNL